MGAAACGLNSLGEKSYSAAATEHMEDFLNALEIRLIKIFGYCAKSDKDGVKSLFDDILVAADHVYVLASETIDGIDKLKP